MQSLDSLSSSSALTGMDYAVSAAGKAKQYVRQQGQAALQLIDSATKVSSVSGSDMAAARGYGSIVDISA